MIAQNGNGKHVMEMDDLSDLFPPEIDTMSITRDWGKPPRKETEKTESWAVSTDGLADIATRLAEAATDKSAKGAFNRLIGYLTHDRIDITEKSNGALLIQRLEIRGDGSTKRGTLHEILESERQGRWDCSCNTDKKFWCWAQALAECLRVRREEGTAAPAVPAQEVKEVKENGNGTRKTLHMKVKATCEGFDVEIEMDIAPAALAKALRKLKTHGIEPAADDGEWKWTPGGDGVEARPICPKHQAAMTRHEKQGDAWYAHKMIDANGNERWCRGCRNPSDKADGWLVE